MGLITVAFGVLVAFRVAYRETAVQVDKVVAAYREDMAYDELTISYPLDGTLFPPTIAAPTVHWKDSQDRSDAWVVTIEFERDQGRVSFPCLDTEWMPSDKQWETIKQQSLETRAKVTVLGLNPAECREFIEGERAFLFDLYRIPFNEGKGGKAEPLAGASNNGMSNYFAKYSPDGRWIVFCKAKSYMLLQPDSELYIIPAAGGHARRMQCNTPRMN